ncbi:MAG: hypothetical protein FJ213_03400 [Ignavibacteria bacterium]|nr:hypothetical protein [Ignavibacteria bacterium]
MKTVPTSILIIILLGTCTHAQEKSAPQSFQLTEISDFHHDVNYLKMISKKLLMNAAAIDSKKLSTGAIMQITGGVLIAGFVLTITVFKQDIFTTLPLALLGSGIALIFMGSSLE